MVGPAFQFVSVFRRGFAGGLGRARKIVDPAFELRREILDGAGLRREVCGRHLLQPALRDRLPRVILLLDAAREGRVETRTCLMRGREGDRIYVQIVLDQEGIDIVQKATPLLPRANHL